MLSRNNLIVVLLIALWVGGWAVKTERVQLPGLPWVTNNPSTVSVVAFVVDNDAPDFRFESEVDLAILELRKEYPAVVKIDETPESVTALKQGPVIIDAANSAGIPAIVMLDGSDKVILSVPMAKTATEMVGQVRGK